MYIWVILAIFMTTLMGFNLHFRSDVREVTLAPLAESIVSKVVIQHNALQSYIAHNKETLKIQSSSELTLDGDDLEIFAPFGFKFNNNIKSLISCVEKDNINSLISCSCTNKDNSSLGECSDKIVSVMATTFMQTPSRWFNYKSSTPTTELKSAIKNVMGYNSSFGYNVDANHSDTTGIDDTTYTDSDYEIKNNDSLRFFIPQVIVDEENFKSLCIEDNIPCILQTTTEYEQ
ncbi:MAG: hypothetical protein R3Y43_01720 [Alphaproteobacteria bacterium]